MTSRGEGSLPVRLARSLGRLWAEIRAWRRLSFTRAGIFFTVGAVAIGLAAINTGNNLLYLLLGAMLGMMGVSGWLSEQTIRDLEIVRRVPRGTTVGMDAPIRYEVRNRKSRMTSWALELSEAGLPGRGFVPRIRPGAREETMSTNAFSQRGIYMLGALTLGTDFPFGLFRKERDVTLPGELVIWPRTDRAVRAPSFGAGRRQRRDAAVASLAAGPRGEYRGLREYRPGDDPRDIHWRSSARLSTPVVREYDREASESLWIALDVGVPAGDDAEVAVEIAASLAATFLGTGAPVGLAAGEWQVAAGTGPGQLEDILDALARADFDQPGGPRPPVDTEMCVLVTTGGPAAPGGWADVYRAAAPAAPDEEPSRARSFRQGLRRFLGMDEGAAA